MLDAGLTQGRQNLGAQSRRRRQRFCRLREILGNFTKATSFARRRQVIERGARGGGMRTPLLCCKMDWFCSRGKKKSPSFAVVFAKACCKTTSHFAALCPTFAACSSLFRQLLRRAERNAMGAQSEHSHPLLERWRRLSAG